MIRRPPKQSEQRFGFARDVETYSFSFYDNGEIVDAANDPRLTHLRSYLTRLYEGEANNYAKKVTSPNFEMTPKEADQFLRALETTLGRKQDEN